MKKIVLVFFFVAVSLNLYSQEFYPKKEALVDFVKRTYNRKPFEGIRIIQDGDTNYLISVVVKQLGEDEYLIKRAASLEATFKSSRFMKEAAITSETIINTTEDSIKDSVKTKMIEVVKKAPEGWAVWMDLLTNFDVLEGKQRVFVYIKEFSK